MHNVEKWRDFLNMFATLAPAHLVREDEKEYNVWPISSIMHEWVT